MNADVGAGRTPSPDPSFVDTSATDVTIAIPTHNAASYIRAQVDGIRRQDATWIREVLLVENASTDTTATVVADLATQWEKIRVITEPRPGGNIARNTGIRESTTEFVLLCDADDVVAQGWASALRTGLLRHELVRGRLDVLLLNDADTIAARGPISTIQAPDPSKPLNGLGSNFAVRKDLWARLGGLDERHHGSDDEEFFWRAQLIRASVGYVDDAVVNYRLRTGRRALYRQQRSWAINRAQLYRDFGASGFIERRSARQALKSWIWLAVHCRDLLSQGSTDRGRWVRVAGKNIGNVIGSWRFRVWHP